MELLRVLIKKSILIKERIKRVKKRSIYCVGIGFIFSIFSFLVNRESIYLRPYEIERGSYGTQKTPYRLRVDVENLEKNMEFSVSVSPRKYDKEEAESKFVEKFEKLRISILGDNTDYENIKSKLNFNSDLGDGIKANYVFVPDNKNSEFSYFVKYQNIIDKDGNVHNENFKEGENCHGYIEIQLSAEVKNEESLYKSEKYLLPIRIVGKNLSSIDAFKLAFKKAFEDKDQETIDKNTIELPKVVNNFRVSYKENRDLSFLLMPILGVIAAVLLEIRDREKFKEDEKIKLWRLEIDYTQIVTKVLIYINSGMTVRNSMIRLAEQYQKKKTQDKGFDNHIAYDELLIVKNRLLSGYSEVKAYEDMATNINLRVYTRFLNIIIQSIKNGNKDLKGVLNMEVQDALYERKHRAKKLGEEAATKLVLPLMMMLAIIMIIIMVPAFMGM